MKRKTFISYKYADDNVAPLPGMPSSTCRSYVDHISINDDLELIQKFEEDGTDLSQLSEESIKSKLKDRIFDSSITIVLVSPNMRDLSQNESNQWIPWEISYSLTENTRGGRTSTTNAVLAVVLPDSTGSYEYMIKTSECGAHNVIQTYKLFTILSANMFNRKSPAGGTCTSCGTTTQSRPHSFIPMVKWDSFELDPAGAIQLAFDAKDTVGEYNVVKRLT